MPHGASAGQSGAQTVPAVQKVIAMLTDMAAKSNKEKANEEIAFAKFSTWCKQESANLKNDIAKGAQAIELLLAEEEKLTSEAGTLGEAIAKLSSDVATFEADMKAATSQRAKDHEDFLVEQQDYSESVDALDRAIAVLQKQDYDRTGTALLQLTENERLPAKARSLVAAFMGMLGGKSDDPDFMDYQAPEANAYEFQSGTIVEILKKLREDFNTKLGQCQKEEMNSKHAYDMIIADLTDSVENAKKDIEEKSAEKERKLEKAAMDKKERAETTAAKEADEKTLSDLTTECTEKKLSYDEKQELRAEEIVAIQKAIAILETPEVSANAEKYLSLTQASSTSLLQIEGQKGASAQRTEGIRRRVREFLAEQAKKLKSQQLELLAENVAVNPFAKVKKMIDDMITRLLEEAKADADHEGFCDTEMGKSKITRNKLSGEIDALQAAIEDGKATIVTLTTELATLSKELEDLQKLMSEATDMRKAESKTNAATIEDAKQAQAAVTAAIAVLKDFYARASTATAFLQVEGKPTTLLRRGVKMGTEEWDSLANPNFKGTVDKNHKKGMQTFGDTYTGQQDEAGGVLALLEVILSDFANLEADTSAAESTAQKAYDELMTQSKKSVAVKTKKVEMDTADKASAELKMQEDIKDMKSTQDELLAADRYHARLVPQCIDKGMTYEEKVKARQEEITSLKEALKILNSADIVTSA